MFVLKLNHVKLLKITSVVLLALVVSLGVALAQTQHTISTTLTITIPSTNDVSVVATDGSTALTTVAFGNVEQGAGEVDSYFRIRSLSANPLTIGYSTSSLPQGVTMDLQTFITGTGWVDLAGQIIQPHADLGNSPYCRVQVFVAGNAVLGSSSIQIVITAG